MLALKLEQEKVAPKVVNLVVLKVVVWDQKMAD
jgi:hypothetical protein